MRRLFGAVAVLTLSSALFARQNPHEIRLLSFEPPELISTVQTYYPPLSVAFGTVVLQVTIGELGQIEEVNVIRHIPSLTEEAIRSVKKWKFKPATLDGKPVRSKMAVAFVFTRRQLFPIPKS